MRPCDTPIHGEVPHGRAEDAPVAKSRASIWVAVILSILYLLTMLIAYDSPFGHVLVTTLVLHVPTGRFASLAAGMALGGGLWPSLIANIYFCFVELAILQALIEHGDGFLQRYRWMRRMRSRLERRATQVGGVVGRWGVPGLIIFVAIPIFMTGPWVGLFVGYVLKMKRWVVHLAVGTGSAITMTVAGLLLASGGELYIKWRPPAWMLVFPLIAVAVYFVYRWKHAIAVTDDPPSSEHSNRSSQDHDA